MKCAFRFRWILNNRACLAALVAGALACAPAVQAQGEDDTGAPLAVIDWLAQPPVAPSSPVTPAARPQKPEPPVTEGAARPEVRVTPLGAASPDAAGLLPPSVTGFPLDLWRGSGMGTLAPLISALDPSTSPVIQRLMLQMLLAEADAPLGVDAPGDFLSLRAGKLAALGAVDQALELTLRAGPDTPAAFATYFDLALLTDQTDAACERLAAAPHLAPGYPARIFCLARAGDWQAAATTLESAAFLGALGEREADLLALFLSPELAEELAPPPVPRRPSPLDVRLYEALGEPIAPADLPPGHAVRDLGGDAGWRAQIEAAERLSALGAIDPARLFGIYAERQASASGGLWERVKGAQALDRALDDGDDAGTARALERLWPLMQAVRLDGALARHAAPRLLNAGLTGAARDTAITIGLLSGAYESAAAQLRTGERSFAAALARGEADAMRAAAKTPLETAIARGFSAPALPTALEQLRIENKLGEVILRAAALYLAGQTGDPREAADAIATFRAVGLEDVARRAGLELLLLDRGA